MPEQVVCSKCGGQMERGGIRGDSSLVWGHIKESSIFGVKAIQMVGPMYSVEAHRCEKCGYIELYATNQQGK